MKLTVLERMMVLDVLPPKGNLTQMRLHNELINKVGLSSDEVSDYEVKQDGARMSWREDIPQEKEIELKPAEVVFVADALKKRNEDEELTPQHLTLYDKFVEGN